MVKGGRSKIVTPRKSTATAHKWVFTSQIRPKIFSWRSSSAATTRIREAVAEIQRVARTDPVTAAEGAVRLLERLSPALEHVDSSSGALGSAVNRAIESLVPIISSASVSIADREKWLERLYEAHAADQIPYIETLADFWGELCVTQELASTWADRMIGITRMALSPDKNLRGHYHGTSACLSALLRAGRYEDIESVLAHTDFWHYKCYAVKALAAQGRHDGAIALADSLRGHWTPDGAVDRLCERILLEAGRVQEAYQRFGLTFHSQSTYLATFRAVAKAYPSIPREQILSDLIELSPRDEGKWFAAAKELRMFDLALKLVRNAPCDPKTLTRAAQAHLDREPGFAEGAGFAALRWLVLGFGYEITSLDVWSAYHATLKAAETLGRADETKASIRELVQGERHDGFVRQILGGELGLL
jgi:hypothetical protein